MRGFRRLRVNYVPLPDNLLTNAGISVLSVAPLLSFLNKNRQKITHKTASVYIFVHVLGGENPCVSYDSPAQQPSAGFIIPSSTRSHVAL